MSKNTAQQMETTQSLSGSGGATLPSLILLSTFLIIAFGVYTNVIRSGCKPFYDSYDPDDPKDDWDIQIHNFSKWTTNIVIGFNLGLFMAYFVPNATIRRPSLIMFAIVMGILSFQTLWYLYKLNESNCPEGRQEVMTAFPIYYSYFGWSIGVLLGALADNIFSSYTTVTSSRIAFILLASQVLMMLGLGYYQVNKCHESFDDPEGPMKDLWSMEADIQIYKWWAGISSAVSIVVLIIVMVMYGVYPET